MSGYTPIDCNFYDELVLLSMRKTPLTFIPNKYNVEEGDFIIDLVTEATKEEFLVLKSGKRIRLDEIASASGGMIFLNVSEAFFEEE